VSQSNQSELTLDDAIRQGEFRARELAARIIQENPTCSELEISALFAERWNDLAEHVGEELLTMQLTTAFREVYRRLTKIGARVLVELRGLSAEELLSYAKRWCPPQKPSPGAVGSADPPEGDR